MKSDKHQRSKGSAVQPYAQTTAESCLAVAALQLVHLRKGLRITRKLELECLLSGLSATRDDWVIGHLRFLGKRFNVRWNRMVEIPTYAKWLKRFDGKAVRTIAAPINSSTITKHLAGGPIAVLLDDYPLFKIVHYPHWVVVLEHRGKKFKIFEPWEGKVRWISAALLDRGIQLLRRHLRWSPQAIQLVNFK
ncbi:MAG TPA: hypothetical protein VJK52_01320 [Candidatus Nanoarchaeia archaeon]|nr:hypothetical protein [Candidatus Nanoarchaeia archaeon]